MYLFLGSIALIFIGSFLPWANLGFFSVNGTEGDGIITIILALIGIVIYFALKNKPKAVKISTIAIGALSLIVAIMSFTGLGELGVGSPGGGLYMVLLGSIGLIVSPFIPTNRTNVKQHESQAIHASNQASPTSEPSSFCSDCGKKHTNGQFCEACSQKQSV